jgi:hypothetical protein
VLTQKNSEEQKKYIKMCAAICVVERYQAPHERKINFAKVKRYLAL